MSDVRSCVCTEGEQPLPVESAQQRLALHWFFVEKIICELVRDEAVTSHLTVLGGFQELGGEVAVRANLFRHKYAALAGR